MEEEYVNEKVGAWASPIEILAKLVKKHPQAVYAGYVFCLQNEWQYLCRTTKDIAVLLEPLERALRIHLLPAFLGVDAVEIDNQFRELLGIAIKRGGIGIRNPLQTAEEFYDTSLSGARYLVNSLVDDEVFDQMSHKQSMTKARTAAARTKKRIEGAIVIKRNHGNPSRKRRCKKALSGTSTFLSVVPHCLNGNILTAEEWRTNVRLLYNINPLNMPESCNGCGAKLTVEHALSCKVGGLVHIRHDDFAHEI